MATISETSALWQACCDGEFAMVRVLLANGDVDIEQIEGGGLTPVQVAAAGGFDDVVELLLEHGADVFNNGDCDAMTTLHWVAGAGPAGGRGAGAIMRLLMKLYVDGLNSVASLSILDTGDGLPPSLAVADANQFITVVQNANETPPREARLDLNAQNIDGLTPLHRAVLFGTTDSLEQLCMAGADTELVDCGGRTAIHYAAAYGMNNKVCILIGYMTASGIRMQDERGNNVLHFVSGRGGHGMRQSVFADRAVRIGIVNIFIQFGIDVDIKNQEAKTAEELAVQRGRQSLVDLLKVDSHPLIELHDLMHGRGLL
jgi:ankyrin repeat protein